jgi:hypothetical protein
LWAVQVLHSRCFYEANLGRHLSVPGGWLSVCKGQLAGGGGWGGGAGGWKEDQNHWHTHCHRAPASCKPHALESRP